MSARLRRGGPALQLWLAAACTTGGGSPPDPQPSPVNSPAVSPEAWTLEETEAQLLKEMAHTSPSGQERRLVTVYYVQDQGAADLLTDWFRGQQGVARASLDRTESRTHVSGVASPEVGAVDIADQQWWELIIEGHATSLSPNDVRAWIRLLRAAPQDFRWRLGPSFLAGP